MFQGLTPESGLSDVLKAFPKNSRRLMQLADDVMRGPGELSQGERELIAAHVSAQNTVGYCVSAHTMFAEVFGSTRKEADARFLPLLDYAKCPLRGRTEEVETAFQNAKEESWSEAALYEVVEVSGLFNFINLIVKSGNLQAPPGRPSAIPSVEEMGLVYSAMSQQLPEHVG